MNEGTSAAKAIILFGIMIVIFGLVVLVVSYFVKGRGAPLPGDIAIHRRNVTVYFPIISSIVISIILSVVLWIISALRR